MKKSEDIKIGEYTLKEIIERHHHWLEEDIEGWENMCADLNYAELHDVDLRDVDLCGAKLIYANLYGANLSNANLRDADLYGAELRRANLRRANLHGADLSNANLSNADLRDVDLICANLGGADLNYAELRCANLSDAELRGANLSGANLICANLSGANLYGANLNNANLNNAKGNLMEYRRGKILSENVIGYKKCRDNVIVTLEIPRGAVIFSINGNKCRTNRAKVIAIEGSDRAFSICRYMSYYIGDEFNIKDFDCQYNVECGRGIHFFLSKEEAEEY